MDKVLDPLESDLSDKSESESSVCYHPDFAKLRGEAKRMYATTHKDKVLSIAVRLGVSASKIRIWLGIRPPGEVGMADYQNNDGEY